MRTKTDILLKIMNVLTWITFIGLMVKAGAIIFSYVMTCINPEGAKNLYNGLNFYSLYQYSFWYYTGLVSLMAGAAIFQALAAYFMIKVFSKIKMKNPFTMEVAKNLETISYFIIMIWVITMMQNQHIKWLSKTLADIPQQEASGDFIFLAGVVFVIAQIFKKGVEIQTENELTV